jgi:hypothetical protein
MLARKALYYLSHTSSPFFFFFFWWYWCCRKAQTEKGHQGFLGSKFSKQAGSDSADSHSKGELANKGGFPIHHLEWVTEMGSTACPIHNHVLFHWPF